MKRISPLILLLVLAAVPAQGDDDTWHNVYHGPRRFGHKVKNTFTDDTGSRSSKSNTLSHRSSKAVKAKVSPTLKPSPTPEPSPKPEPSAAPTPARPARPSPSPASESSTEGTKGSASANERIGSVASLTPAQLRDFNVQPPKVQELIRNSLALTERKLSYQYGSADPASGGMDCSGFIYYVLNNAGFEGVPRQSSDQYLWVRKNSIFHAVISHNPDTFELKDMQPGDLMFWSGTYQVDRDVPITHVMIYLGREKGNGRPVMVGASDGRTYDGRQRYGVSVFDFRLPSGRPNKSDPELRAKFEGYAAIPGLRNPAMASSSSTSLGKTAPQSSPASQPLTDGD